MTILQKLQAYENAVMILAGIPDYGWPQVTQFLNLEGVSTKTNGAKNIQAWYDLTTGWKVMTTETWTDSAGDPKSERVILDELTSSEANTHIESGMS